MQGVLSRAWGWGSTQFYNLEYATGIIRAACRLLDKLPDRSVVAWSPNIARYAQQGLSDKTVFTAVCGRKAWLPILCHTYTCCRHVQL